LRPTPLAEARRLLQAANLPFCGFVLALGVVVLAVRSGPVGDTVDRLMPDQTGLVSLLGATVLAAMLANLVNNLPATLMLVPLVAQSPGLTLAVLLGVNIGPNLTYVGSLATLLWRQALHARGHPADAREFLRARRDHRLGVPAGRRGRTVVEPRGVGILLSRPRRPYRADLLLAGMHPRGGSGTLVG
jgi:arsenical pump membrane protein